MNINCVICAELFINPDDIYTTPCGHVFHYSCLIQWIERSKSCPQCRNKCTEKNIHRIFFNIASSESLESPAALLQKIDDLQLTIREKDKKIKTETEGLEKVQGDLKKCAKTISKLETLLSTKSEINRGLQHQIDILKIQQKKLTNFENENTNLMRKVNEMTAMETVLYATQRDVEELLKQNQDTKTLVVMIAALKRELSGSELRKQEIKKQLHRAQAELRMEHEKKKQLEDKIIELESDNHRLSNKAQKWREPETDIIPSDDSTPELKKKRLLDYSDVQNTPSPLSTKEMLDRAAKINNSESPYLRVSSSSIGLEALKRPFLKPSKTRSVLTASKFSPIKLAGSSTLFNKPNDNSNSSAKEGQYSIFKKPRLAGTNFSLAKIRQSNLAYNGFGGSSKILLSEEKEEARKLKPF